MPVIVCWCHLILVCPKYIGGNLIPRFLYSFGSLFFLLGVSFQVRLLLCQSVGMTPCNQSLAL